MIFCIAPAVKNQNAIQKSLYGICFCQNTHSSRSGVISQSASLYPVTARSFVKLAPASLIESFSQSALSEQLILIN